MESDDPIRIPLGRALKKLRGKKSLDRSYLDKIINEEDFSSFLGEGGNYSFSDLSDSLIHLEDPLKQQELRESIVKGIEDEAGIKIAYSKLNISNTELKNQARVKIRRDSRFAHQNKGLGTMQGDFGSERIYSEGSWARVTFDNGYSNSYREEDLEPLNSFSEGSLEKRVKKNKKLLKKVSETPFEDFKENILKQIEQGILNGAPLRKGEDAFKVGDKIEMIPEADDHYHYTRSGSRGKVIKILGNGEYEVHFTRLTGSGSDLEATYGVRGKFMQHLSNPERLANPSEYAKNVFTTSFNNETEQRFKEEIKERKISKLTKLLKENKIVSLKGGEYQINQEAITDFFSSIPSVYERVPHLFSGGMYAPFAERQFNVAQFELTTGCSHNKCTFCNMYEIKHTKKSTGEGELHIDGVMDSLPDDVAKNFDRIFIANGDALGMPTLDLNHLIQYSLRKVCARTGKVPRRVALFGSTKNVLKKSHDDLHFLNCGGTCRSLFNQPNRCSRDEFGTKIGLGMVYLGIESGSDEVLDYINKGCTARDHLRAGKLLEDASIRKSVTVIPGLGGKRFSDEHVEQTTRLLNILEPEFITFIGIDAGENSAYTQRMKKDKGNSPLTDREVALQTLDIIEGLKVGPTIGCYSSPIQTFGRNPFPFGNYQFGETSERYGDFIGRQRKILSKTKFPDGS